MEKREEERPPFNERAALEELERFQGDIERYRRQRKAVGDEFEAFVKTLKAKTVEPSTEAPRAMRSSAAAPVSVPPPPVSPAPSAPLRAPLAAPEPRAESPSVPTRTELPPRAPEPAPRPVEESLVAGPKPAPAGASETSPAPPRRAAGSRTALLVVVLLLVAGGVAWMVWPGGADETPAPVQATTPSTPAAPAPEPAPPPESQPALPQPSAATAPASTETVITTTQHVWMRVTADGSVVREAEFPAGSRIAVRVENTLVIRTGNAGAVTLTLRGKDLGPLGAEGRVVTRTFTIDR